MDCFLCQKGMHSDCVKQFKVKDKGIEKCMCGCVDGKK